MLHLQQPMSALGSKAVTYCAGCVYVEPNPASGQGPASWLLHQRPYVMQLAVLLTVHVS
jgi:hypothetical protein